MITRYRKNRNKDIGSLGQKTSNYMHPRETLSNNGPGAHDPNYFLSKPRTISISFSKSERFGFNFFKKQKQLNSDTYESVDDHMSIKIITFT